MMNEKVFCVCIMTNPTNTVTYTGVTSDLPGRVFIHKNKLVDGFTSRYNINKLVYYEVHETAESAISREKKLKGSSRARKVSLINSLNPQWKDLYEEI